MKRSHLLLFVLLMPALAMAQQNEPVRTSVKTNKAKQEFALPDHIKLSKQELNQRVEEKTRALTSHIQRLAQLKDNKEIHNEIAETMKLFNNDDRKMVTVTSIKNPTPVTKPIRKYLVDLAKLHYDKVRITWQNAQYVTNFTKQPDGTYNALVAVEQVFTGIMGGEVNYVYRDVTQKRAEVTVKVRDIVNNNGAVTQSYAEVFLGNIGVTEE